MPFVYLCIFLWENVHLGPLTIFKLDCMSFDIELHEESYGTYNGFPNQEI